MPDHSIDNPHNAREPIQRTRTRKLQAKLDWKDIHSCESCKHTAVHPCRNGPPYSSMLHTLTNIHSQPFVVHKIYQLDYSRKTGEFRMQERTTNVKGKTPEKNKDSETKGRSTNTGVWPPEMGVHRVAWNNGNGLGGAPLLASATASGLCRVDWLMGRWIKDKTPYVSVPKMRKEVEGASDESVEEA